MTKHKHFKRRVRERQRKTGESYTAARARMRQVPIETVPDATPEAERAGFACRAFVSAALRVQTDLTPLFVRVRELLEALGARACGPLLRGEAVRAEIPEAVRLAVEARRFLGSVRAGARGLSADERLLAVEWQGAVVVGAIVLLGPRPLVVLGRLDDLRGEPALALMGIGG